MIEGNSSKGFERILKLFTIFLIVGIFSLNLIYSSDFNFKPITKINPLKQPIFDNKQVNYTPKITIKDLEKYTLFERVQMEKIGKLLDSSLYFKTSSLSIDVNEDCYLDVNLEKYIKNLNNLNYDLKLVSKDVDVNNCGFENKNLQCSFNSNFNGDVNIIVGLNNIFSDDDELLIKVDILPVNDDPVLNEDLLGEDGYIKKTLSVGEIGNYDLRSYTIDPDVETNYIYNITTLKILEGPCHISDYNLICKFDTTGNYEVGITLIDDIYNIYFPFKFNVIDPNTAPTKIKDFETLGQTTLSNETFTIDLAEYFYDEDDDELTYGFETEGDLEISYDNYNSAFSFYSTGTGYKDLNFYAYDGKDKTYLNTYRIAVIDSEDISGFDSSYTILENINFNLKFSLQNNLGYEIYNLPVSIESEGLDISKDYNLNFGPGEEKIIYQNLEIPDVNTSNVYEVKLTVFGIEKIKNDLNVIDYVDLNNYVSIEKIVPEKDTKVPHSVILAIPFTVINNLDSNVELYYCGQISNAFSDYKLYNSNLEETLNNFFCEQKTFEPGNNTIEFYTKVGLLNKYYSAGVTNVAYLSETQLERDPINYLSSDYVSYDLTDYYNEDVYGYVNLITPSVNPLKTNTNYNAIWDIGNYSSFDIIDLNVCAGTYYKEDSSSNEIANIEDYYYKILSNPNCFTIDRLESNVWTENVVSFDFKTKDNTISNAYQYPKEGVGIYMKYTNQEIKFIVKSYPTIAN